MLSDFPAPLFSGSTFEPDFIYWENHEPSFLFHSPSDEPVAFSTPPVSSGSDTCSKEPARVDSKNKKPGSSQTSCLGPTIDERKRKRKISNRESARRSRERKQKHLEDLRIQVNRLKVENRELMNRLRYVVHYTRLFCTENEYLRSESVVLTHTLWKIRQVLLARQLLNIPTCINNNYLPINPLIT